MTVVDVRVDGRSPGLAVHLLDLPGLLRATYYKNSVHLFWAGMTMDVAISAADPLHLVFTAYGRHGVVRAERQVPCRGDGRQEIDAALADAIRQQAAAWQGDPAPPH